jgi:hypothetical protein
LSSQLQCLADAAERDRRFVHGAVLENDRLFRRRGGELLIAIRQLRIERIHPVAITAGDDDQHLHGTAIEPVADVCPEFVSAAFQGIGRLQRLGGRLLRSRRPVDQPQIGGGFGQLFNERPHLARLVQKTRHLGIERRRRRAIGDDRQLGGVIRVLKIVGDKPVSVQQRRIRQVVGAEHHHGARLLREGDRHGHHRDAEHRVQQQRQHGDHKQRPPVAELVAHFSQKDELDVAPVHGGHRCWCRGRAVRGSVSGYPASSNRTVSSCR